MTHWLVTGANGNLGRRLIGKLLQDDTDTTVTALVRSTRAQQTILDVVQPPSFSAEQQARLRVVVVDYEDTAGIASAAAQCERAVHLVGILKATRAASYEQAHQRSCAALVQALPDTHISHVTYMSIVGSSASASNACLRSKGEAEDILCQAQQECCVLRVPMVLGEGDYASFALRKRALSRFSFGFRNNSLEQPIYAGDVVDAIVQAGTGSVDACLDLAGPEVLTRAALTRRAAQVLQRTTTPLSLPIGLGLLFAGILEKLTANPQVTRAMLEVLDHDDEVDPQAAVTALQLAGLTPLDEMLQAVLTDAHR